MRSRLASLPLLLIGLIGCSSAPEESGPRVFVDRTGLWPELVAEGVTSDRTGAFPARPLDEAQIHEVREASAAWRAGDQEAWEGLRTELSQDPLAALWLTRMLIVEVLRAQRDIDSAAVMVGEDRWQRPTQELITMGAAAAPCVTLDLLCSSQADRRLLGKQVLEGMGPEQLPSWSRVMSLDEVRVRRSAIETIASWGILPTTQDLLEEAIRDPDFGIRAAGWRGFAGDTARLAKGLAEEQDPFVRRAIYTTLALEPDRAAAGLLVKQLEMALEEPQPEAIEVLQRTLRQISGSQRDLSVDEWQNWLDTYQPTRN